MEDELDVVDAGLADEDVVPSVLVELVDDSDLLSDLPSDLLSDLLSDLAGVEAASLARESVR